jgi:hypothetical protein
MIDAETTLLFMVVIMLYSIERYDNFYPINILWILAIPTFVANYYEAIRWTYGLTMILLSLSLNLAYMLSRRNNKTMD